METWETLWFNLNFHSGIICVIPLHHNQKILRPQCGKNHIEQTTEMVDIIGGSGVQTQIQNGSYDFRKATFGVITGCPPPCQWGQPGWRNGPPWLLLLLKKLFILLQVLRKTAGLYSDALPWNVSSSLQWRQGDFTLVVAAFAQWRAGVWIWDGICCWFERALYLDFWFYLHVLFVICGWGPNRDNLFLDYWLAFNDTSVKYVERKVTQKREKKKQDWNNLHCRYRALVVCKVCRTDFMSGMVEKLCLSACSVMRG